MAFRATERVGSPRSQNFRALSPGPLTRPPTLRFVGHPTLRKESASRGWTPPEARLARIVDVYFSCSLACSSRFVPAHVPVGTALSGRPPDRTRRADFPHRAPTLGQRRAKRVCLARFPIRCRDVSASGSRCVEDAFRATDFPSAEALPSIDSTGVTRVFADFFGTTTSSDFSTFCAPDCGVWPSWADSPDTIVGRVISRSPGSRSGARCKRAELQDPGGRKLSTPTLLGCFPWPSAQPNASALHGHRISGLYRPARSLALLRFASWVTPRCARNRLLGGGLLPRQDLLESSMFTFLAHLLAPAGLCRRTGRLS